MDVAYLLTGSRTTSMVSAYFNRPLLQIVGDANFTDPQPTVEFLQVPVFDAALAAGAGAHNHAEAIEGAVAFRKDWLRSIGVAPTSAVIARARGDSMQPTIQDGDMLLIDRGRSDPPARVRDAADRRPAQIYALVDGDSARIKRLERVTPELLALVSDNPSAPTEYRRPDDFTIIGRVMWWGHTNRE